MVPVEQEREGIVITISLIPVGNRPLSCDVVVAGYLKWVFNIQAGYRNYMKQLVAHTSERRGINRPSGDERQV